MNEEKNSFAIAGFICSIVGFLMVGIASIAGLILSIIGLKKSNINNEKYKVYALVGLILSIIKIIIMALTVAFVILMIKDVSLLDNVFKEKEPTLVESNLVIEEDTAYITGKIYNDTGKDIDYYSVYFETFDDEGNITGTCSSYIDRIPKNKTWKFEAHCDASIKNIKNYTKNEVPTF